MLVELEQQVCRFEIYIRCEVKKVDSLSLRHHYFLICSWRLYIIQNGSGAGISSFSANLHNRHLFINTFLYIRDISGDVFVYL